LGYTSREAVNVHQITSQDYSLSYLPLSHIAEQMFTILIPSAIGSKVYYYEGPLLILENLKQIQPTIFFGPPRIWEKLFSALSTKVPFSQLEKVPKETKLQLTSAVGLSKCKLVSVGAAPIDISILKYFFSLGITILEVYGQSEDCGPTSFNTSEFFKLGSAGKPFKGIEVKIAEDGEILVKGPSVFKCYYNDEKSTQETLKDGWLYSGDLGRFDEEGYLYVTGRKKDIIITAGGKNITPLNIETALKLHPYIGEATVCGDKRKYLTALISPYQEIISNYCKEKNIDPNNFLKSQSFKNEIRNHVTFVNKDLGQVEKIKKYTILPVSFSIEGGELTPTFKMKRAFVNQKYAKEIDFMYAATATEFDSALSNFVNYSLLNSENDAYYIENGKK